MELPSAYVYGGIKRKRSQGDCLRSALESHVREQLNMASLKAQDKKLMAWTLGELAFFAYKSAMEKQNSGSPAAQAVRSTNFYEAASCIASERGLLTPDAVLRRVSANMATRFWESRLPEALESFIERHAPAPRNVVPRAAQAAPVQPHRRTGSPAAPRGHAAVAAGTGPTVPAQQLNAFPGTGGGPSNSQPGPAERNAQPPPQPHHTELAGGGRPLVRSFGTQTWASSAAPTIRPPPEPQTKQELKEDQGTGPLGPIPMVSSTAPSRRPEGRLAPSAVAAAALKTPTCTTGAEGPRDYPRRLPAESHAPPAAAGEARLGSDTTAAAGHRGGAATAGRGGGGMEAFAPQGLAAGDDAAVGGRDKEESLPYTQRLGAGVKSDREALRQKLLPPPLLGASLPGNTHPPCQDRDAWPDDHQQRLPPQPQSQQQRQQPAHRLREQFHVGHPHGLSGLGSPSERTDAGRQQQQRSAACQTTPSSKDATAAAAAAATRRAAWSEPAERVQEPNSLLPDRQQQQETRDQPPTKERYHPQPHAEMQAAAQQSEQQEHRGRAAPPPPPPLQAQQSGQQEQQLQGREVRSSALLSGLSVPLARRGAAPMEAQPESSSAAAASGGGCGGDPGPSGTGAPGRTVAGGRHVALAQRGSAADGRAASGVDGGGAAAGLGPSVAAVAGGGAVLAEPPWEQLRREYEKRLEAEALEKRLRKHLSRKGNSMIKKYCYKAGLPWTLLEVACYGVALQKLSSKPFDTESAVRFLARVKGWRQGDGGATAAAVGEARGPFEAPPAAFVQKVAAAMDSAVAKYELTAFIERQRRCKKPPAPAMAALVAPHQQAAVSGAAAAAAAAAAGPRGLRLLAEPAHPPGTAQPQTANHLSPAETLSIGVTAPATAGAVTTTTAMQHRPQQHSAGGGGSSNSDSMPSGGAEGDDSDVEIVGETSAPAAAAPAPPSAPAAAAGANGGHGSGGGGVRRGGRGKAKGLSTRKRSRGSAGGGGSGGAASALELRLRAYLSRQGVKKLGRRNASEGVGWTLLDLVEADRDVRLQKGCDDRDAGEVVDRLLQNKLPPGTQLPSLAVRAVSVSVCKAYDKLKLGVFVASEVNKRLKRQQRRG